MAEEYLTPAERIRSRIAQLDAALAERTMVEQATLGDATHLRSVAQDLSIRLDPDGRLPKDKHAGMTLVFGNRNHAGFTPMTAMLDDETVEKIRQAVEASDTPAAAVEGVSDQRSAANRQALALGEIAQHFLNSGEAPSHGGQRPNVTVFMGLDHLAGRIRPCGNCGHEPTTANDADGHTSGPKTRARTGLLGMLGSDRPTTIVGGPIPAEVARRITCDSRTTPIVEARDQGCTFPGCDRPPGWTEAHQFKVDGAVSVGDGVDRHERSRKRQGYGPVQRRR